MCMCVCVWGGIFGMGRGRGGKRLVRKLRSRVTCAGEGINRSPEIGMVKPFLEQNSIFQDVVVFLYF